MTEIDGQIMNSTATNQSELLVSEDSSEGIYFSLAARVVNGIIISILFAFGIGGNVMVLHAIRVRGILLKNTSIILTHLIITDLICCLAVLPQDFAFYVVNATFPQVKKLFKVCSILKNAMIFLNCGFATILSVERHSTVTYIGRRRSHHLSKALMLCLIAVWLASLIDAVVTYYTFNDSNQLPWKLPGQATNASSRRPSAGTILALVLVLVATITVLFSLHRLRSFLHQINTEAKEAFQGFSKRETRRRKMQKRITSSCFASLLTLAISYLPLLFTWLLWYGLGIQNIDANSFAHVLCSLVHTINPLIATALSSRLQSAFLRILKSFYPFHTLLKRYPSFADSISSFSSQSLPASFRVKPDYNLENIGVNNNYQDVLVILSASSQDVSKTEEDSVEEHEKADDNSIVVWDRYISSNHKEPSTEETMVKKEPLRRKRSLSTGNARNGHLLSVPQEHRIKRLSDSFINKV